jgi:multiple antibiotic resistance protein
MEPSQPIAVLAGLLFTLVGPVKAMPTFYGMTATMEPRARNALALKAAALGALGIAIAAAMGKAKIEKIGISREALGAATGLVLAIVGLMPLVGFDSSPAKSKSPPDAMGLAFPILVPPYAFGLIVLIGLYLPTRAGAIGIIALGIVLMAINAVAMIIAPPIMRRTGSSPLRLLGAVFGILQLALGVQMLLWGITNGIKTV